MMEFKCLKCGQEDLGFNRWDSKKCYKCGNADDFHGFIRIDDLKCHAFLFDEDAKTAIDKRVADAQGKAEGQQ